MQTPFAAYHGNDPYIFVSYAHEDSAQVFPELAWLHEQGVNIWYDEGISPGREWREELGRAIRESQLLLFFVSPRSAASAHCRREVNDALDQDIDCLTVYLEPTNLPDGLRLSLSGLQAILSYQESEVSRRSMLLSAVNSGEPVPARQGIGVEPRRRKPGGLAVAAALAGAAVLALLFFLRSPTANHSESGAALASPTIVDVSQPVPGFSDRAAIAVIPFANMSEDMGQDYFADAITEDLITGLQSFRSFPVIARTSTFQYKGRPQDARVIAAELGAGYIIEGSVRRVGERVRINVQLSNAQGQQSWAQKYDYEYRDVLDLQDQLTRSVLEAIEPELILSETDQVRHVRPEDMQAWDYYIQAVPNTLAPWAFTNLSGRSVSQEQRLQARELLLRALEIEPRFAGAFRLLNHVESWSAAYLLRKGNLEAGYEAMARAIDYGKQARQLSPFEPTLCSCLAADLFIIGDTETALRLQEEALKENPSNALVHGMMAKFLQATGDYERALQEITIAKRLDPRSMSMSYFLTWEASVHLYTGAFAEALALAQSATLLSPFNTDAQLVSIASLMAMNRRDDAQAALRALYGGLPEGYQPFATFPAPFPDKVAAQVTLSNGETLIKLGYQDGMSALFAELERGRATP